MLNPRLRAYLDNIALTTAAPISELTPQQVRAGAVARLTPHLGDLIPMANVDELYISGPTAELPIRIYRPELTQGLPAIIMFHGGGWVGGNINLNEAQHRMLAQETNCVVIAVNYQKAPEHKFPIPHDDCYFTLEWVFENAMQLGIDPRIIGVGGDSAGANLAIGVALRARDTSGPKIAFQVLIYPSVDHKFDYSSMIDNAEGYNLTQAGMRWYLAQYLRDDGDLQSAYAIPMRAKDFKHMPACTVLAAEYDPLRDEAEAFAERLKNDGVNVHFKLYDGMIHGFCFLLGLLPESQLAFEEIGIWVRQFLGN
jgi:acetyl esterase